MGPPASHDHYPMGVKKVAGMGLTGTLRLDLAQGSHPDPALRVIGLTYLPPLWSTSSCNCCSLFPSLVTAGDGVMCDPDRLSLSLSNESSLLESQFGPARFE